MPISDPARRRAVARLENLSASPAPEPLRRAAETLRQIITRDGGADEDELVVAGDSLADAIADLPGTLASQLDLMRVLHGEAPAIARHSAGRISAALRDKAWQLGRLPTQTDIAPDHPVWLFAWAYWGGVDRWSADAPARAQKPKHYWSDRSNQVAALRQFVAGNPGKPITAATLAAAGLCRLALLLDAAQLEALAEEAGLDRSLCYRTSAWWTAERVIDAYAAHCRRAGVTLSTTALTAIGGEASSLRAYAQRHYGRFRLFQQAVTERHPDVQPPERPTTADGFVLDSWSEVALHNAPRRAMPDVPIQHHVILPGEKARSADFLLDGRVWLELLSLSYKDMAAPRTSRQRKYASQWLAKCERYVALGIKPVVLEPADVDDAGRLTSRIAEIAALLEQAPRPLPPPSGRQTRAKGSWDFEMLCSAVAAVSGSSGKFPTDAALIAAGYGHAVRLLRRRGEKDRVAAKLGLQCRTARGSWTSERVVTELVAWVTAHGAYPSKASLMRQGRQDLQCARDRVWAGRQDELRAEVARRSGLQSVLSRAANGSYADLQKVVDVLRPLAERLGRMPTCAEASTAGLSTAWSHASRRWGVAKIAAAAGVPYDGPRRRDREQMLAMLGPISGGKITTAAIRAELGSGGIAMVRRCGGIASVRTAIARMACRPGG